MTDQHVNDLATSFVAMARAFEELPGVKLELEQAKRMYEDAAQRVQERELSIHNLNVEIERLNDKIREAEGRADAAETMFLECDDKLAHVLDFLKGQTEAIGTLVAVVQPPKVEAEPVEAQQSDDRIVPQDYEQHGWQGPMTDPAPAGVTLTGDASNIDSVASGPVGESANHPTTAVSDASGPTPADMKGDASVGERAVGEPSGASTESPPVTTVSSQEPAPSPSQPQSSDAKPFHGKLYVYTPGWVSREAWIAGGGTAETYDWREGDALPNSDWVRRNGRVEFDPIQF